MTRLRDKFLLLAAVSFGLVTNAVVNGPFDRAAADIAAADTARADFVAYRAPVRAAVIDGFRPPSHVGAPGNRGLEYGTVGGEQVVAAAAGQVLFASQVGGNQFVTVLHDDGLRTSYSFVDHQQVAVGDVVAAGAVLAQARPGFHFGVRIGETYLDPAILLGEVSSVSTPARLVPVTMAGPSWD